MQVVISKNLAIRLVRFGATIPLFGGVLWVHAGCGVRSQDDIGAAPEQPLLERALESADKAVVVRDWGRRPEVDTGLRDDLGRPVRAACGTCHLSRPANAANRLAEDLDDFHQGLVVQHGSLRCVACHNADRGYDSLRLADGSPVNFEDVMQLCAQCHGPQHRDYLRGAHGGMQGYWDPQKGPRLRNNCLHCHDPHAPKYPAMRPAKGPNDRFLSPGSATRTKHE